MPLSARDFAIVVMAKHLGVEEIASNNYQVHSLAIICRACLRVLLVAPLFSVPYPQERLLLREDLSALSFYLRTTDS